MPPVAPRSDYNPLPGMAGGGGGGGYGAMPPQVAAPVAMPQPTAPPPGGGHQVILAEAQVLMQQLEQRLQTQLGHPNVDHNEVMRQLGQLRALQQQATQILTQPGQPIPMAAPAQTGLAAPNLVQNLQGLGQGQQARETILSLLQGTLASVISPATTLSPPSSQPMGLPGAGAFVAAPAPYAPLQAPAPAPAGIPGLAPPAPAMAMPTEDLLKNLMSMGMIGGPAAGMPAAAAPVMPAPAMVGMTQQPPMPAGMMPSQPGMPPMGGMPAGYPPQGGMPGMPMGAAGGMAGRGPYPGMPGAGGFDAAPPATHRRLDLATENVQVNKLYADFELQCGTCGLRFNDKDKMAKHLDWHFAMNKKEKQKTKKAVSRLWFTTADEWATGIDVAEKPAMPFFNEAAMEESAETPVMNVIADESQTHCGICGEKFDQFWENDLEEWMYRGAVKVEGTGQLFHQKCYEQAAAMTQQAQAQQQQQQEQEAATTTSASTNADSSTTTNNGASSSHQFWVKKEPEGEEGASRQNNANDTTPTPSFSSAEGSRASA